MTKLSIDLLTAATKLWSLYRTGEIDYPELNRRLVALEKKHGVEPWGDQVDRGWEAYRDQA